MVLILLLLNGKLSHSIPDLAWIILAAIEFVFTFQIFPILLYYCIIGYFKF